MSKRGKLGMVISTNNGYSPRYDTTRFKKKNEISSQRKHLNISSIRKNVSIREKSVSKSHKNMRAKTIKHAPTRKSLKMKITSAKKHVNLTKHMTCKRKRQIV